VQVIKVIQQNIWLLPVAVQVVVLKVVAAEVQVGIEQIIQVQIQVV
jgi:hypothetical protein